MTDKFTNTAVEILGKQYAIRCPASEIKSLQDAASYLNKKMLEVQESGKAINLERIAIMTALNIAYELLQGDSQKEGFIKKLNQHILNMQEKIDHALHPSQQTELVYSD
jgi:cell division protein ZapA